MSRFAERARVILAIAVLGASCSSSSKTTVNATDGGDAGVASGSEGGADVAFDASEVAPEVGAPGNMVACRVPVNDPLTPCAPTSLEQEARYQGTPFGELILCSGHWPSYWDYQDGRHSWQCIYGGDGALEAWDRIENGQQFCDGRASAAVGDIYSRYQLPNCLAVDDADWTWIQSFDPGPTTISVKAGTGTTIVRSQTISVGLEFVLGGQEIEASDLTFRYWYTADGALAQQATCDGTNGLVCDQLTVTTMAVSPAKPMADSYAEVSFPNYGGIISTGFRYDLGFSITRGDSALYDQSNDYSYGGSSNLTLGAKVTAYVKGALVYGTEP
jgi:hypothetical protein